ncbi:ABC transporter permease [Rhodococcus sp. Eu-32]|uniref:ABC transporter permease n=1 Tax=Rhodococcus sp. Eu-32 TaxID=1017319 RepID=UPI000DF3C4F0|nr:ABC transporter permease [Rhodococcus sp. Eu-32]RRQ29430.1 ABC transporter permease [Rhodococcus sp. Eu-32]
MTTLDVRVLDDATLEKPQASPVAPERARDSLLRRALAAPGLVLSWIVVGTVIAWAFVPGLFTSKSPYDSDIDASFAPPSLAHPFGADRLGRDLLARVIHGTSTTLSATLLAVLVGLIVGSVIGLLSGFIGGRTDAIVMRFVDVLLAIPGLLLAMTVVTALGYGTLEVAFAVGITAIAAFARVMRSEVLKVARSEYVEAAYGSGAGFGRVVFRHVLPNSRAAVFSLAALECGSAILAVAALGFLGYGAPPPQPEWGLAVSEGRDYLATYPWIAIFPGIVIAAVVLATNRISKTWGE